MKPLAHYLADWSDTNPVRIPERIARELCKATQRGTVPRLGRFLAVTLESGERRLLKRVSPRHYVLLYML